MQVTKASSPKVGLEWENKGDNESQVEGATDQHEFGLSCCEPKP